MSTLRYRRLASGKYSIYIDCYDSKKQRRSYAFLKLYVSRDYSKGKKITEQDSSTIQKALEALSFYTHKEDVKAPKIFTVVALADTWIHCCGKFHAKQLVNHLKAFCGQKQVPALSVDHAWMDSFGEYLGKKLSINSVYTLLSKLGSCYKKALAGGGISVNPIADYKVPETTKRDILYLENDEMRLLAESDAPVSSVIRDVFWFSLHSGLRFDDIRYLTPSQVKIQNDDETVNRFLVHLENGLVTELNDGAAQIMEKYYNQSTERVFNRVPQLNEMNRKLDLWAAWAGLAKNISFSVARNTCIINLLRSGMPLMKVRRMMNFNCSTDLSMYKKEIKLNNK
jgi:site-specific recombinase XerD